jgi:hypothetical protein
MLLAMEDFPFKKVPVAMSGKLLYDFGVGLRFPKGR